MRTRSEARRAKGFKILLALAVLAAAAAAFYYFIYPEIAFRAKGAILLPVRADQTFAPFEDGVLCLKDEGMVYFDRKGNAVWTAQADAQSKLAVSDKLIALYTPSKAVVYSSLGAMMYEIPIEATQGGIVGAAASNDYIALHLRDSAGKSTLEVYDKSAARVDQITAAGGSLLCFGFSPSGSLWAVTVQTSGTRPQCMITTYNPGRTVTGSITVSGQIIYSIVYSGKEFVSVGTNTLQWYSEGGKAQKSLSGFGWDLNVQHNAPPGLICLLPDAQGGSPLSVAWLIESDSVQYRLPLRQDCFTVLLGEKLIYCVSPAKADVYDMKGRLKRSIELPVRADRAYITDDRNSFIVASGDEVYLVPIS